ncbi:MAG: hypothetical protein OEL77_05290 [Nitrosopumilus sp.]|nr:hypothetical protein [Nitrosopumilus sp.]MDH3385408.1 hypothetical protein [Nitrosopumilus sp.]
MQKIILLLALVGIFAFTANYVYAQEVGLATFQETAQVIVDKSRSQNVTASITLQSTSIQEIQIPPDLEKNIRENGRVIAIVITNQQQCILGVLDESCIMINVKRDPSDKGIIEIQESTKAVAELFIDEINEAFDTNAEFHSIFVHSDDEINKSLETSGVVSGRGTVSAVYTMPMEDTSSMYEKISAILIPKIIRDSGGFYDTAKNLSLEDKAKVTFSIIPFQNNSLLQLKLSIDYPQAASNLTDLRPLEFLGTDELKRSEYFSSGFYPLNSIFQIVILSEESASISNVRGSTIPTQIVDGEKIPIEIIKKGWVFDPEEGERIQGKYIFGQDKSIYASDLIFSLERDKTKSIDEFKFDESMIILAIIIIGGIGAAVFFLKGYKK